LSKEYDRGAGRELAGLIIIVIGFGLLMNSMGILPIGPYIARFWLPAMFMGFGVFILSRSRGGDGIFAAILFIGIGLYSLLNSMHYLFWGFHPRQFIGPAILMWIGTRLLLRGPRQNRPRRGHRMGMMDQTIDAGDYIHATAVLGGFNRKASSQQFRGGDVTAIMGGGKIDLRDAQITSDEAVLDVFTMMGGMEIQVPHNWIVEQRFTPILGGYEDKTRTEGSPTKTLAIHGTTIMGGISVTN